MSGPALLAVHAHPDDESITMGGTLAAAVAAGFRVVLVTATLGEEGEVVDPELQGLTSSAADQLGGYRYAELEAALSALGVTDGRLLGGIGAFRDSGMAGTAPAMHPRAFVRAAAGGPDHERAVAALAAVIEEIQPVALLTYQADGGYGHPDHVTAHQVAVAAAERCAVPRVLAVVRPKAVLSQAVSAMLVPAGYHRADPAALAYVSDSADLAVDVAAATGARQVALAAHATQLELLPGGFALTNRIAEPLLPAEYFALVAGPPVPTSVSAGANRAGERTIVLDPGPVTGLLAGL